MLQWSKTQYSGSLRQFLNHSRNKAAAEEYLGLPGLLSLFYVQSYCCGFYSLCWGVVARLVYVLLTYHSAFSDTSYRVSPRYYDYIMKQDYELTYPWSCLAYMSTIYPGSLPNFILSMWTDSRIMRFGSERVLEPDERHCFWNRSR